MLALVSKVAAAVFAAAVAGLGSLGSSLTTGESLGQLDAKTWVAIVLATIVAGGGVHALTRKAA